MSDCVRYDKKKELLAQLLFVCDVNDKSVLITIDLYFRRKFCVGTIFNEIDFKSRLFGTGQVVQVIAVCLGVR